MYLNYLNVIINNLYTYFLISQFLSNFIVSSEFESYF
jgi:hypothetical protein